MPMQIYKEDKGINFGKWEDATSKFLYKTSTEEILSKIKIPKLVADYGGANGNMKKFIPNSISIDIDETKNPDILDNILEHKLSYDLVILRYVLHYLNDYQVIELFETINAKNILIIQFTNEDLKLKYFNSKNEFKYFRTKKQLESLLPSRIKNIYSKEFICTKEFYKNRLGIENSILHSENLQAYYL